MCFSLCVNVEDSDIRNYILNVICVYYFRQSEICVFQSKREIKMYKNVQPKVIKICEIELEQKIGLIIHITTTSNKDLDNFDF